MQELFSLTHHFIIKNTLIPSKQHVLAARSHHEASIEDQILIWLLVYNWDPSCLHYWGIVAYSALVWLN
jgi:hypothetical protein